MSTINMNLERVDLLDEVIAAFSRSGSSYAICERCNCPYDKSTGRHSHTGSNLCSDLLEKCNISGHIIH